MPMGFFPLAEMKRFLLINTQDKVFGFLLYHARIMMIQQHVRMSSMKRILQCQYHYKPY